MFAFHSGQRVLPNGGGVRLVLWNVLHVFDGALTSRI